jgi:hypothetical protein
MRTTLAISLLAAGLAAYQAPALAHGGWYDDDVVIVRPRVYAYPAPRVYSAPSYYSYDPLLFAAGAAVGYLLADDHDHRYYYGPGRSGHYRYKYKGPRGHRYRD